MIDIVKKLYFKSDVRLWLVDKKEAETYRNERYSQKLCFNGDLRDIAGINIDRD